MNEELKKLSDLKETSEMSGRKYSFLTDILQDWVNIETVKELCLAADFPNRPTDILLNGYAKVNRDTSIISADSAVSSTAGAEDTLIGVEMSRFRRRMLLEDDCFKVNSWPLDLNNAKRLIVQKLYDGDEDSLNNYLDEQIVFLNCIRGAMGALKDIGVKVYEISHAQPLMKIFLKGMCDSLPNQDTYVRISTTMLSANFRNISFYGQTDLEFLKIGTDELVGCLEAKRPFGKLFHSKSAFAEKDQLYIENEAIGSESLEKFSVGLLFDFFVTWISFRCADGTHRILTPRVVEAKNTVLLILLVIAGCTEKELLDAADTMVSVEEIPVDESDPLPAEETAGGFDSKPRADGKPRTRSSTASERGGTENNTHARMRMTWTDSKHYRISSEERQEDRKKLVEWDMRSRREPLLSIENLHL
jgi:hypothetical protein